MEGGTGTTHAPTLLLVDDNDFYRDGMRVFLTHEGVVLTPINWTRS